MKSYTIITQDGIEVIDLSPSYETRLSSMDWLEVRYKREQKRKKKTTMQKLLSALRILQEGSEKMSKEFYNYKRHQIMIAKELFYDDEIIERLRNATTEAEIEKAMITGRKTKDWRW